jgi:phage tail-like protein
MPFSFAPKSPKGEYPLPGFYFSVEWSVGGKKIANGSFTEISGLNEEIQMLEYRDGLSKEYSTQKIAGMRKDSNITLKRGVFHGNNEFYDWWNNVKTLIEPEKYKADVTIKLLGEDGSPRIVWTLTRAWPVKYESPGMKSDTNDVAIETIELVHEGLTIKHEGGKTQ